MRSTSSRRSARALAALASVLAVGAFAPAAELPPLEVTAPVPQTAPPARGLVTDHVIVISVDGLRPDAIERFGAGTMQRLMREGSHTLRARTILPSKTLPSHTSMLTGVEPEDHGITWNTDETETQGTVEVPTIFEMARERGFQTAAFFSKTKFHHLEVPNSLDHVDSPESGKWSAERTLDNVGDYLEVAKPNLLFVHIGEPDYAGHYWGWMSGRYGQAVRVADHAVATVLTAANRAYGVGNYTVILTADHGGHGRNHGSADPRDVTIPWIAWGKGVTPGQVLPDGIRTMDTAATAMWLLGVPNTQAADGAAVLGAFHAPVAQTLAAK
jgi:predicted AlkP superfamily pyrophosphatase or phosphodiesterase